MENKECYLIDKVLNISSVAKVDFITLIEYLPKKERKAISSIILTTGYRASKIFNFEFIQPSYFQLIKTISKLIYYHLNKSNIFEHTKVTLEF